MNAAAAAALARHAASRSPEANPALLFLHADTRLPYDAVACVRGCLADPRVVAGGFVSVPESPARAWWFMAWHNSAKAVYAPLLFKPASFARGLRLLFGDQALFCRAGPFQAVGGYDEGVPILEDADLCLKLHAAGPAPATRDATPGRFVALPPWSRAPRGRVVLLSRPVATDGRRFEVWGNARATLVHVALMGSWYAGASAQQLRRLYGALYGDIRSAAKA